MEHVRSITPSLIYLGANDRRLSLFENLYPIPRGVSYNSYLIMDEKTVLMDTVDKAVAARFFENLEAALNGRALDYLVVSHVEPDHAATIGELILRHPKLTLVCNAKALTLLKQFRFMKEGQAVLTVNEGDTLDCGKHRLHFVMAPMVHWPEVMVSFEETEGTLFSADAFGTFGALEGSIYADETDFERDWLPDARRYYTNIVGKYGTQVKSLLSKAAALNIQRICPLHGPVWRKELAWFIDKYQHWSRYEAEEQAVLIAYASIYSGTENAAEHLAALLAEKGLRTRLYDVSVTHSSELVAEAFRASHLVFAAPTYNAGLFDPMEALLKDLAAHNLQNRTVGLIQNGSWAPVSGRMMLDLVLSMKNMTVLDPIVTLHSAPDAETGKALAELAEAIFLSFPKAEAPLPLPDKGAVDPTAFHAFSYGLFVLSSRLDGRDYGCIVNTAQQLTSDRITVAVNKQNYTNEIIKKSGVFAVSILKESAPFDVFRRFGFQSGRDTDKWAGLAEARTTDGIRYLAEEANAVLSARVVDARDYGTHTIFVGEVTEARRLSKEPSITYTYYFAHTKPKKKQEEAVKRGFICRICGYVYEGEELPKDFVCPLCGHGAADFDPLPYTPPKPKKKGWVCKICGYIYEGEVLPPDFVCPLCKHGAADFEPIEYE